MKLVPKNSRIPNIGVTEFENDPIVHLRLFHPLSNWAWYLIEYSKEENLCFGLIDGDEAELGYFSLLELESLVIKGVRVERDLYWIPMQLSVLQKSLLQR